MKKPIVIEHLTNNGEHSHWLLMSRDTGEVLWSEKAEDTELQRIDAPRGILILGGSQHMPIEEHIARQLRTMREMSEAPTYQHGTAPEKTIKVIEEAAEEFVKSLGVRYPLDSIEPFILTREDYQECFLIENKAPYGPSKNKVLNLNTKQDGRSNRNLRAARQRKIPRSRKNSR